MAPQDTGGHRPDPAARWRPRRSRWSRSTPGPTQGNVYMVVRADNRAYGRRRASSSARKLGGKGKVVELEGDLASINGRDRTEAFNECMKTKFPGIKVFGEADRLGRATSPPQKLQTTLDRSTRTSRASTCSPASPWPARCRCSSRRACWSPPGDPKHVFVVSNDGIPEELKDIAAGQDRRHRLPAGRPVRQVRARTTLKAAVEGKTFKPGPTDHDSTIIQVRPGVLEDQLPAPLVTRDGATYGGEQASRSTTSPCGATTCKLDTVRARASGTAPDRDGRLDRRARRSASPSGTARPSRSTTRGSPCAGRDPRAGRPQRRGQVDPGVDPHRPAGAGRRRGRRFAGEPAPRARATATPGAQRVACVYQKSTIIPTLTVAENLFLNRHDRGPARLISWRTLRARARDLLADVVGRRRLADAAGDLTVEQRQFVEIARALSFGARFIILDEPTAQLDGAAIARLFDRIRDLQAQGVTFLFISHHLQEVYEICDTVTVFRDARHILTAPVAELAARRAGRGDDRRGRAGWPARTRRPAAPRRRAGRARRSTGCRRPARSTTSRSRCAPARSSASRAPAAAASSRSPRPSSACGAADGGQRRGRRHAAHGRAACRPRSPPASASSRRTATARASCRCCRSRRTHADRAARLGRPASSSRRRRDACRARADRATGRSRPRARSCPVSALSGGNQQKVVMARALANDPRRAGAHHARPPASTCGPRSLLGRRRARPPTRGHRRADRLRRARRPARAATGCS